MQTPKVSSARMTVGPNKRPPRVRDCARLSFFSRASPNHAGMDMSAMAAAVPAPAAAAGSFGGFGGMDMAAPAVCLRLPPRAPRRRLLAARVLITGVQRAHRPLLPARPPQLPETRNGGHAASYPPNRVKARCHLSGVNASARILCRPPRATALISAGGYLRRRRRRQLLPAGSTSVVCTPAGTGLRPRPCPRPRRRRRRRTASTLAEWAREASGARPRSVALPVPPPDLQSSG